MCALRMRLGSPTTLHVNDLTAPAHPAARRKPAQQLCAKLHPLNTCALGCLAAHPLLCRCYRSAGRGCSFPEALCLTIVECSQAAVLHKG